jgi:hypothetical protein
MNSPLRRSEHPRSESAHVESIRRAAVMTKDVCFSLSPPADYARILAWIKELGSQAEAPVLGFITSKNRFVNAVEAHKIARDAGQDDQILRGIEAQEGAVAAPSGDR